MGGKVRNGCDAWVPAWTQGGNRGQHGHKGGWGIGACIANAGVKRSLHSHMGEGGNRMQATLGMKQSLHGHTGRGNSNLHGYPHLLHPPPLLLPVPLFHLFFSLHGPSSGNRACEATHRGSRVLRGHTGRKRGLRGHTERNILDCHAGRAQNLGPGTSAQVPWTMGKGPRPRAIGLDKGIKPGTTEQGPWMEARRLLCTIPFSIRNDRESKD